MTRLVYSTGPDDSGRRQVERDDEVPAVRAPSEHDLRVRVEKSGRGGKTVTLVGPLFLEPEVARTLLRRLKRGCGSGGTLKTGPQGALIEIQGDQVDSVLRRLGAEGFPARRAGG